MLDVVQICVGRSVEYKNQQFFSGFRANFTGEHLLGCLWSRPENLGLFLTFQRDLISHHAQLSKKHFNLITTARQSYDTDQPEISETWQRLTSCEETNYHFEYDNAHSMKNIYKLYLTPIIHVYNVTYCSYLEIVRLSMSISVFV